MNKVEIIKAAADLVGGDRNEAYGDATEGYEKVAAVWSALLYAAGKAPAKPLDAHDAANMMEALKIVRRYVGPYRADNYIDGAGYAGVAGEIALKMKP